VQQIGVFAPAGEIALYARDWLPPGAVSFPSALEAEPGAWDGVATAQLATGVIPEVADNPDRGAGPVHVYDPGIRELLNPGSPTFLIVVLGVVLLCMIHFDAGGSLRVRR
jgi:hypothetical protein